MTFYYEVKKNNKILYRYIVNLSTNEFLNNANI